MFRCSVIVVLLTFGFVSIPQVDGGTDYEQLQQLINSPEVKQILNSLNPRSGRGMNKDSRFLGLPNIFDIVQPIVTEVRNALQPVINAAVVTAIDLFLQPVSVDRLLTAVESSNKLKPLVMNIVEFVLEKYTLSVKVTPQVTPIRIID